MLAVLVMVGGLLVFSASAEAAITFTSVPPTSALAGASYQVSATDSTGAPVALILENPREPIHPCSWTKPPTEPGLTEADGVTEQQPLTERASPATLYLVGQGTCVVVASAEGQRVSSETITVTRNPTEQIPFTTPPPTNATVGGTYSPHVRPSSGVTVHFTLPNGDVCVIYGSSVSFLHAGTCTIDVRQLEPISEGPEGEQTFTVSEPSTGKPTTNKTGTEKLPTKVKKTKAKGRISAKVRGVLLREALAVAARHKDRHPSLIEAVRITEAQAQKLENETRQGTTMRSGGAASVYFVAMRGSFQVACAAAPGQACTAAPVLMLRLSVSSEKVMEGSLTNSFPDLESVGIPVALNASSRK